jgi:hypothetical protein
MCGVWYKEMASGPESSRKNTSQENPDDWIRNPNKSFQNGSIVWKAVQKAFSLIGKFLIWKVGNGQILLIRKDP